MKNRLILLLLLLAEFAFVQAQVTIVPIPYYEGRMSLDDVWRVNLISPSPQPLTVEMELRIETAQHQLVMSALSPAFTLMQGNSRPEFHPSRALVQYGNASSANTVRTTGHFPYGDYIVCYNILLTGSKQLLGEFCQEKTVQPAIPLELISPYNLAQINTTYPLLTWKAPFPPSQFPFEYSIKLTELKSGQSPLEALEQNMPLVNKHKILTTNLPYPPEAMKLEYGKSYVWQVSAKSGNYNLGVTETWQFTIVNLVALGPNDQHWKTYKELKLVPDGSYYPIKKYLRFVLNNRWGAPSLNYEPASPPTTNLDKIYYKIYPAGKQDSPLVSSATTTLLTGPNRLTLNLSTYPGIVNGEQYIMIIKEISGKEFYLEFTYYN